MKKAFIIVLTILAMVGIAAAQADGTRVTVTAPPNTNYYNADGKAGHIQHGCMLCHAPHSASATISNAAVTPVGPVNKLNFDGGAVPPGWTPIPQPNGGGNVAGSIYLWGTALTAQTYTTWDGSNISSANVTNGKYSAVVHTLLCMSCHDNANSGYLMGLGYGKPTGNEWGVTNVVTDAYGDHIGLSTMNSAGTSWDTGSSLQNSHPVHAVYSSGGTNWKINTDGTFVDTTFALTNTLNGHPAKLWMDGGVAYVECTTCHDPHRETEFAFWNGSAYTVGTPNSTVFYLRGPYTDPTSGNGNTNANFCRSCHYSKSQAYQDNSGASK